jgi:hypothetical protein
VDNTGQAAAAGLIVDKAADDLATASSAKTQAALTYMGKPSGEQRWRPVQRDHSGSTTTYPTRTAARRGRARSGSVASERPGQSVLIPRALTEGGCLVSARAQWPGARMALTGRPSAGLSTTDRWSSD